MPNFLITWLLSALALLITAFIIPGITIKGVAAALVAAAILGFVNAVIRPLFILLTLPISILTLGLFLLFINPIMLMIASALVPGFTVKNLLSAVLGSICLTFVTSTINELAGRENEDEKS